MLPAALEAVAVQMCHSPERRLVTPWVGRSPGLVVQGAPPGEGPLAAGTQAGLQVFAFHSPSLTITTRSPAKAPAHHAEIQKIFDHVSGF